MNDQTQCENLKLIKFIFLLNQNYSLLFSINIAKKTQVGAKKTHKKYFYFIIIFKVKLTI